MHEMSIVLGIVKIAETEAIKAGVDGFAEIELEIGTLSGVQLEALNFAWQAAVSGSVLERAVKHIHTIQAKALCSDCQTTYDLHYIHDCCPQCGSFLKHVTQGKELRVKSLDTF
jgi:hydrogenase nickel incorporation protein HypA/HybF